MTLTKLPRQIAAAVVGALALVVLSATPALAADWRIYHTYSSFLPGTCYGPSKNVVPLRYGDLNFGLIHIEYRHGDFSDWDERALGVALQYGRVTRDSSDRWEVFYPNWDGWKLTAVVSKLCQSPSDNLRNGVITYYNSRA
jgi:hypothetical protein